MYIYRNDVQGMILIGILQLCFQCVMKNPSNYDTSVTALFSQQVYIYYLLVRTGK